MGLQATVVRLVGACSAFLFLSAQAQPRPLRLSSPLNQEYFLFSHNAATGYLEEKTALEDITVGFAKNQVGTLTDQLNCGARAFDLRPAAINGGIFFRHGDREVIEIAFQDAIQEILNWANLDSSEGELILLKISPCREGSACNDSVAAILNNLGVELITDCSEYQSLTVGGALERGPVLALEGSCFVQNYDPTVNCHGFLPDNNQANVDAVRACTANGGDDIAAVNEAFMCMQGALTVDKVNLYDCWASSNTNAFPTTQLLNHLNEVAEAGPPQDGRPWQWQALWQVVEDSVTLSIFRPVPLPPLLFNLQVSTILLDVEESQVNRIVLELVEDLVENGVVLNLVEIDNVCDTYGRQFLETLRPEGAVGGPPTMAPSAATLEPTSAPSVAPTTTQPSSEPSSSPPSSAPTTTMRPSVSIAPSNSPSSSFSPTVSSMPSYSPSASPSTSMPSETPSSRPSLTSTVAPTATATSTPTASSTMAPSSNPTTTPVTPMPTPRMIQLPSGGYKPVPLVVAIVVVLGIELVLLF